MYCEIVELKMNVGLMLISLNRTEQEGEGREYRFRVPGLKMCDCVQDVVAESMLMS